MRQVAESNQDVPQSDQQARDALATRYLYSALGLWLFAFVQLYITECSTSPWMEIGKVVAASATIVACRFFYKATQLDQMIWFGLASPYMIFIVGLVYSFCHTPIC